VEEVVGLVDGIQIGARHMQNFPLLVEAGRTGKPVLLKRHMAADVDEWLLAAEYVLATGNEDVILCERGLKSGERHVRYLLDVGVIPYLKQRVGLPVIVDPSHAAGDWRLVPPLARAAVAAGADGLIVEVHPRPEATRSDALQALPPDGFLRLMDEVRALAAMDGRAVQPARASERSAVGI
jgi:3-deoxy-7-phosphoheptulonate synthase